MKKGSSAPSCSGGVASSPFANRRTIPMLYAGIDYHKRYSQVHVVDERGHNPLLILFLMGIDWAACFRGAWSEVPRIRTGLEKRCHCRWAAYRSQVKDGCRNGACDSFY